MQQALRRQRRRSQPMRLAELDALLKHLAQQPALDVESEYVELFDRGRRTALHLFEHVHGDSRDRGPAMIDLIQTYEKGGLYLGADELPDHLPVVLEFASTQPPAQAREFLGEIAHIVRIIFSALQAAQSPYASVLAAVLELAGEKAEAVAVAPEPAMDDVLGRARGVWRLFHRRPGQARPAAAHPHRQKVTPFLARSAGMNTLHNFLFNVYPYICLSVFLMGSLARFDRDQYTWKSDSSQLLRKGQLRWGSNLFHIGILFLFGGHTVGLLTPHFIYEPFITAEQKQLVAVTAGGIAGVICFIGLSLLLHRRIFDDRIRLTSHRTDLGILIILWVQLVLGLITLPYSFGHQGRERDAGAGRLGAAHRDLAPRRRRPGGAMDWPYKVHLVLGMTIFLLFPFSRLVHVWSGFGTAGLPVPPLPGGAQPQARPEAGRSSPARRLSRSHHARGMIL